MTNQYSIPLAVNRANAFFTHTKFNPTFLFDTPIPPGVIPSHQRQPKPRGNSGPSNSIPNNSEPNKSGPERKPTNSATNTATNTARATAKNSPAKSRTVFIAGFGG